MRTFPALCFLAFGLSAACKAHSFGELSVEEVARRRSEPGFFIYDNNPKSVFLEGHVPGARWVAFDAVTQQELPADKEATLVFYCANEH